MTTEGIRRTKAVQVPFADLEIIYPKTENGDWIIEETNPKGKTNAHHYWTIFEPLNEKTYQLHRYADPEMDLFDFKDKKILVLSSKTEVGRKSIDLIRERIKKVNAQEESIRQQSGIFDALGRNSEMLVRSLLGKLALEKKE